MCRPGLQLIVWKILGENVRRLQRHALLHRSLQDVDAGEDTFHDICTDYCSVPGFTIRLKLFYYYTFHTS
jgi:hypothetical protein